MASSTSERPGPIRTRVREKARATLLMVLSLSISRRALADLNSQKNLQLRRYCMVLIFICWAGDCNQKLLASITAQLSHAVRYYRTVQVVGLPTSEVSGMTL